MTLKFIEMNIKRNIILIALLLISVITAAQTLDGFSVILKKLE